MVPLDDGTFRILASLDDYGDDQRILTRKATYKDICNWVKETYGVPVKNVDISRANGGKNALSVYQKYYKRYFARVQN